MVRVKINEDDGKVILIKTPSRQTKKEKQEENERFAKIVAEGINWDRVFKKKY